MNRVHVIKAVVMLSVLGTAGIAQPQHDDRGDYQNRSKQARQYQQAQPAQQAQHPQETEHPHMRSQPRPPQPKQETRQRQSAMPIQNHAQPQQAYGGGYHGGVQVDGPTYGGVHHSGVPQQESQVRSGFGQSRANSWQNDHQSSSQRGGYYGYRIPESRFRQYFGQDHFFRVYGLPLVVVGGMPRFQYDGYWVTIMDPWPETWRSNWYETDDVYLDHTEDGYYLYDRAYPGFPVAITITF